MRKRKMSEKILYLMAIDWYWIKQRPQILAEMLSADYDITVAYHREVFIKIGLRQTNDELKKSIPIPVIPYRDKSRVIHYLQKRIFNHQVRNIEQFDIIWIGHPLLYRYIPSSYQGKIVYDCMDNHIALCNDLGIRKVIDKTEDALIERAELVITSSNKLKEKIKKKYQKDSILVRNGFVTGQVHSPNILFNENVNVGYFGTIAEWIDFNVLISSLNEISSLKYFFWGPILTNNIPQHDRIFFKGIIEHAQLWNAAKDMDCLIMPFIVNDVIEDVDPVKLYEYISMGKIIIAPYYEEIKRFEPYVYFYHNEDELIQLLNRLQKRDLKSKYTEVQQDTFLEENTWDKRYKIICENLIKI